MEMNLLLKVTQVNPAWISIYFTSQDGIKKDLIAVGSEEVCVWGGKGELFSKLFKDLSLFQAF